MNYLKHIAIVLLGSGCATVIAAECQRDSCVGAASSQHAEITAQQDTDLQMPRKAVPKGEGNAPDFAEQKNLAIVRYARGY